jgi:ATP-dependent DNA ligase
LGSLFILPQRSWGQCRNGARSIAPVACYGEREPASKNHFASISNAADNTKGNANNSAMPTTNLVRSFSFIHPCQPIVAKQPPSAPDWAHELKHDGYQLQIHLRSNG